MKEADGGLVVTIEYQGACRGCASASIGTLAFVEEHLKNELDPGIRVLPV
jgi:NifU-like protein